MHGRGGGHGGHITCSKHKGMGTGTYLGGAGQEPRAVGVDVRIVSFRRQRIEGLLVVPDRNADHEGDVRLERPNFGYDIVINHSES